MPGDVPFICIDFQLHFGLGLEMKFAGKASDVQHVAPRLRDKLPVGHNLEVERFEIRLILLGLLVVGNLLQFQAFVVAVA